MSAATKSTPVRAATDDAFSRAVRERDALRERLAFWETHKGALLFPALVLGGALGYGVGHALHVALHLPDLARWLGLSGGVALLGKALTSRYDPGRLDAAQQRVRVLEAAQARASAAAAAPERASEAPAASLPPRALRARAPRSAASSSS